MTVQDGKERDQNAMGNIRTHITKTPKNTTHNIWCSDLPLSCVVFQDAPAPKDTTNVCSQPKIAKRRKRRQRHKRKGSDTGDKR